MFNFLFDNIGGKIKKLVVIIFAIMVVCFLCVGIALCTSSRGGTLPGVLVMICGPIISWISSWLLYAFGDLVENISDNAENTREILELLRNNSQNSVLPHVHTAANQASNGINPSGISPHSTVAKPVTKENAAIEQARHDRFAKSGINTVVCPHCGLEQPTTRKLCWKCGTKLMGEEISSDE